MDYKNKIFKAGVFSIFLLISFIIVSPVTLAAGYTCQCHDNSSSGVSDCDSCVANCTNKGGVSFCTPVPDQEGTGNNNNTTNSQPLPNPLGTTSVNEIIARAIELVLSLVGSISLLMFVWGGFTWMTSAGSNEKIKKGRDIIVWSVIGLAIVFTSYVLVKFVIMSIAG
jgi:hypothetical protein